MVFNATFNNISVILWQLVLLVEEILMTLMTIVIVVSITRNSKRAARLALAYRL